MSILTKILLIHCLLHVNLPCFLSTNLNPICDEQNNGAKIVTNLSPDICAQYNLTYEHKGDTDCYSKCYKPGNKPFCFFLKILKVRNSFSWGNM